MNNVQYNNNSVSVHQTEFDVNNLKATVVTALKQEHAYETDLIAKDRYMNTEEKIELSRHAMYKYIGGAFAACTLFYILGKYVF